MQESSGFECREHRRFRTVRGRARRKKLERTDQLPDQARGVRREGLFFAHRSGILIGAEKEGSAKSPPRSLKEGGYERRGRRRRGEEQGSRRRMEEGKNDELTVRRCTCARAKVRERRRESPMRRINL